MASATARSAALKNALAFSESLASEADSVLEAYTARLTGLATMVAPVTAQTQVMQALMPAFGVLGTVSWCWLRC